MRAFLTFGMFILYSVALSISAQQKDSSDFHSRKWFVGTNLTSYIPFNEYGCLKNNLYVEKTLNSNLSLGTSLEYITSINKFLDKIERSVYDYHQTRGGKIEIDLKKSLPALNQPKNPNFRSTNYFGPFISYRYNTTTVDWDQIGNREYNLNVFDPKHTNFFSAGINLGSKIFHNKGFTIDQNIGLGAVIISSNNVKELNQFRQYTAKIHFDFHNKLGLFPKVAYKLRIGYSF